MKQFLAVYTGVPNQKWDKLDENTKREKEKLGMEAWGNWGSKHAKSIVVDGAPLGSTLKVDSTGIHKTKNNLCGFVVINAESHEEAAKKFLEHPHFSIFPGDAVEIMECLSISEM